MADLPYVRRQARGVVDVPVPDPRAPARSGHRGPLGREPGVTRTLAVAAAVAAACTLSASASPEAPIVLHGSRARPLVALTFDADMTGAMREALRSGRVSRWYDPAILAELRATHTPATIFVTGLWAETYPRIARSLAHDPLFELENHSYDHAGWEQPCYGLPSVPTQEQKREEVHRGAVALAAVTGRSAAFFRFPGGCESRRDVRLVEDLAEKPVNWAVVSGHSHLL